MGIIDNKPYAEESLNLVYDLLFADNLRRFQDVRPGLTGYPWDFLLSGETDQGQLEKIAVDSNINAQARLLAMRRLNESGKAVPKKVVGVVLEAGLKNGLDVVAAFDDANATYINCGGSVVICRTPDAPVRKMTSELIGQATEMIAKIGPHKGARPAHPGPGDMRISFLVSDGFYFGAGPIDVMFNDPFAAPAVRLAVSLMQELVRWREQQPA